MDKQSVDTARTFLEITSKISEHQAAIKGLRQNLKGINVTLMGTMKNKALDVIETNNGKDPGQVSANEHKYLRY